MKKVNRSRHYEFAAPVRVTTESSAPAEQVLSLEQSPLADYIRAAAATMKGQDQAQALVGVLEPEAPHMEEMMQKVSEGHLKAYSLEDPVEYLIPNIASFAPTLGADAPIEIVIGDTLRGWSRIEA